jgi:hypothetical protein
MHYQTSTGRRFDLGGLRPVGAAVVQRVSDGRRNVKVIYTLRHGVLCAMIEGWSPGVGTDWLKEQQHSALMAMLTESNVGPFRVDNRAVSGTITNGQGGRASVWFSRWDAEWVGIFSMQNMDRPEIEAIALREFRAIPEARRRRMFAIARPGLRN